MDAEQGRPATAPWLVVRGLTKSYTTRSAPVLDGIDLEVRAGELVVVLGESGCGKTTMLKILAGLQHGDGGSVAVGGEVWFDAASRVRRPAERRDVGLVFQNYALWPHWTVAQNVAFPLEARRVPKHTRPELIDRYLRVVHCEELRDRLPSQLSGGQQQRVALARALVSHPRLLLLDEPLSNLDTQLRAEVRRELKRIHEELAFTGVLVTHDQAEALELGTVIVIMRDGRLEQVGAAEDILRRPATPYVATFFGIRNHLGGAPAAALAEALGRSAAGAIDVYVRPEDTQIARSAPGAPGSDGTVVLARGRMVHRALGGATEEIVVGTPDAGELTAVRRVGAGEAFQPGDEVTLTARPGDLFWFRDGRNGDR